MPAQNANNANKQSLDSTDLQNDTVHDNRYVAIAEVQATKKKWYSHGFGTENRNQGNTGFAYFDLATSPDGGTTINRPRGKLRLVVYESDDLEVPKEILSQYDLQDLREAATDARTERPVIPVQPAGAKEDEVIAWEVKLQSGSGADGDTVRNAESEANLPYSEFRQ